MWLANTGNRVYPGEEWGKVALNLPANAAVYVGASDYFQLPFMESDRPQGCSGKMRNRIHETWHTPDRNLCSHWQSQCCRRTAEKNSEHQKQQAFPLHHLASFSFFSSCFVFHLKKEIRASESSFTTQKNSLYCLEPKGRMAMCCQGLWPIQAACSMHIAVFGFIWSKTK